MTEILSSLPLDMMMFAALIGGILLGYPVSFAIAGVAVIFALLGWLSGQFDVFLLGALGQRIFGLITNDVLIAIPLFIFMGVILERSRIAEELLETMGALFGRLRGGLGVSVVLVGALLAASTGIVGATVVAMGMIALPTMLRNRYQPELASGVVATAGTLGQIIPPSTLLIILSDVMSNAYQKAQYAEGKFTIETISVGQIFAAALFPGLLLVGIYIVFLLGRSWVDPDIAPALTSDDKAVKIPRGRIYHAVLTPVLLILAVLGSILGGVATPSEAASVGAVGALLMAGERLGVSRKLIMLGGSAFLTLFILSGIYPVRLQRDDNGAFNFFVSIVDAGLALFGLYVLWLALRHIHQREILKNALTSTMIVTAMIFATILMASVFSLIFIGLGGEETIAKILELMPGGATGALIFSMLLIFVLGFFLDFVEITVILLPLVAPVLIMMGHDPIWLTVLIAINLQTSFLTPPFGFSLFYLRGAAPKEITTGHIYRGVFPFILLQIVGVIIIWFMPQISSWLPKALY